jgi:hypothetical protein
MIQASVIIACVCLCLCLCVLHQLVHTAHRWFWLERSSVSANVDGNNWLSLAGLASYGQANSIVSVPRAYTQAMYVSLRMLFRSPPDATSTVEAVVIIVVILIGSALNATIFGQVRSAITDVRHLILFHGIGPCAGSSWRFLKLAVIHTVP